MSNLPEDLFVKIITEYLDVSSIYSLSLVCSKWCTFIQNKYIWSHYAHIKYGITSDVFNSIIHLPSMDKCKFLNMFKGLIDLSKSKRNVLYFMSDNDIFNEDDTEDILIEKLRLLFMIPFSHNCIETDEYDYICLSNKPNVFMYLFFNRFSSYNCHQKIMIHLIENDKTELIEFMLKSKRYRIDVIYEHVHQETSLLDPIVCAIKSHKNNIVNMFLESNSVGKIYKFGNYLRYACLYNNHEIVNLIIDRGACISKIIECDECVEYSKSKINLLKQIFDCIDFGDWYDNIRFSERVFKYAYHNDKEILELLYTHQQVILNGAIEFIVEQDDYEALNRIFAKEVGKNRIQGSIREIVELGKTEWVERLINSSYITIIKENPTYYIYASINYGRDKILKLLCDKFGTDILGNIALADSVKHPECFKFMYIHTKCDINNEYFLEQLFNYGHVDTLEFLLEQEPDIHAIINYSHFETSVHRGNIPLAIKLHKLGYVKKEEISSNLLHYNIIKPGYTELFILLSNDLNIKVDVADTISIVNHWDETFALHFVQKYCNEVKRRINEILSVVARRGFISVVTFILTHPKHRKHIRIPKFIELCKRLENSKLSELVFKYIHCNPGLIKPELSSENKDLIFNFITSVLDILDAKDLECIKRVTELAFWISSGDVIYSWNFSDKVNSSEINYLILELDIIAYSVFKKRDIGVLEDKLKKVNISDEHKDKIIRDVTVRNSSWETNIFQDAFSLYNLQLNNIMKGLFRYNDYIMLETIQNIKDNLSTYRGWTEGCKRYKYIQGLIREVKRENTLTFT